jgi:hypothetical protein
MMNKHQNTRNESERFQTKSALHEHVRQILVLERLCSRFHRVAKQMQSRYDNRETMHMEDEHDIHDLLHALLMLEHDDVRPIEWTPIYADGKPRTDFLLKMEQVVIIAKKSRIGLSAGELAEQLKVDLQKYLQHPDCKTLVCFVYDPEGNIVNPHALEHELSEEQNGITVRFIIAPKRM